MSYINYCNTKDFKFGPDSKSALRELEEITESGNFLASIVSAVTFFNIFSTRNYPQVVKNITDEDWEQFAQSLIGLNRMAKKSAALVAWGAYGKTQGKEQAFWGCMWNALI